MLNVGTTVNGLLQNTILFVIAEKSNSLTTIFIEIGRVFVKPNSAISIKAGKISAVKDEHGEWQIDAAELHGVYRPVSAPAEQRNDAALADAVAMLRTALDDMRQQRDAGGSLWPHRPRAPRRRPSLSWRPG
jgi:hypothetical protein